MKQHDFAILGLDQFSNTFNSTRYNGMLAPFVVLMVVVDSGYEGPQASLNNLDDFASLTRGQVHFLSTLENIEKTFKDLEEPGLHFVALSQYEMKKKVLKAKNKYIENSSSILYKNLKEHQNSEKKILVVSYGVNTKSVKATLKLCSDLNIYPDLLIINRIGNFSINEELNFKHDYLHVIIIDDSKSENKYSKNLAFQLLCDSVPVTYFERKFTKEWTEVFSDEFIIPFDQLKKSLIG